MLVTERHLGRYSINLLESQLNSRMDSFNFNYNNTDREPEELALFLDNVCAADIVFGSACCI